MGPVLVVGLAADYGIPTLPCIILLDFGDVILAPALPIPKADLAAAVLLKSTLYLLCFLSLVRAWSRMLTTLGVPACGMAPHEKTLQACASFRC